MNFLIISHRALQKRLIGAQRIFYVCEFLKKTGNNLILVTSNLYKFYNKDEINHFDIDEIILVPLKIN